jgi:hypothetical protein
MNAFEKFDADRALRRQNFVLAWSQFRIAVNSSVASFNKMEEGIANPAKLEESPELLTVNCKRQSTSGSGLLNITAKMTITETQQVAILARVEFWSLMTEPPSNQGADDFTFLIEPETELSLSCDGVRFTPNEAADKVLMKALLGLPKASGISAVKRNAA